MRKSTATLTENNAFPHFHDRLLQILDSDARIPFVSKAGDYSTTLARREARAQDVEAETTLEAYRQDRPHWEMVLDIRRTGKLGLEGQQLPETVVRALPAVAVARRSNAT